MKQNIILLPGWGMSDKVWSKIAKQLEIYYCVTVLESSQDNIKQLPTKAIWMGWSMGGLVALAHALKQPDNVEKLILVNSSPCFMEYDNWPGIKMEFLQQLKLDLVKNLPRALMHFTSLQLGTHKYPERLAHLRQLKTQYCNKTSSQLIAELDLLCNTDLRAELNTIKCPLLFILGQNDKLVPEQLNKYLPQYNSQAWIEIIPNAAHIPFISHSELFLSIIMRFLHARL